MSELRIELSPMTYVRNGDVLMIYDSETRLEIPAVRDGNAFVVDSQHAETVRVVRLRPPRSIFDDPDALQHWKRHYLAGIL